MTDVEIHARETIFVLDGGSDAALPRGSAMPVLVGPEAVFVAGRVAADAPTLVRIGPPRLRDDLVRAYVGALATPQRVLRVVTVTGDVLAEVSVGDEITRIEIFLSDLEEPDEIHVALADG